MDNPRPVEPQVGTAVEPEPSQETPLGPPTAVEPEPASHTYSPPSSAPAVPGDNRNLVIVIAGIAVALVLVVAGVLYFQNRPLPKIMARIDSGSLVVPVGTSAFDLYQQAAQDKSLSQDDIAKIAAKALPLIEGQGNREIQEFHDTSKISSDEEWENLRRMFQWATMLRPGNPDYRAKMSYTQGQTRMLQSRWGDAGSAFNDAVSNGGCFSLAYNGLGRVALRQQRKDDAERFYRKATECDPNWAFPWQNLCALYFQMDRMADSESACQRTLQLDNRRALAHYYMAAHYDRAKRNCDALRSYQNALQFADPSSSALPTNSIQKRIQKLSATNQCN